MFSVYSQHNMSLLWAVFERAKCIIMGSSTVTLMTEMATL